jgi:hypothetical protein
MDLDAATVTAIGASVGGVLVTVGGGIGWVCNRVDKQFAVAKAEASEAREEIKAELADCDRKHQKCEEDRLMFREEVIGLRMRVETIARSQGVETKQQQANTADIQSLKDHAGDR